VALDAGERGMHPGQRIVRIQRVVEFRIEPIDRRVAGSAIMRQTQLHVGRVIGADEVRRVAGVAIRRRSLVHVVDVARCAWQSYVRSGERIARKFQMVKLRVEPGVHCVAAFAGCRKSGRHVIENRRLKILLVAGVARSR